MGERGEERERIAGEMDDTVVQGFQGLVLRFEAATRKIPPSESARKMMEEALDRADLVIAEGRDRVRDLRTSPEVSNDLSQSLARAGEEIARGGAVAITVVVEGRPRDLQPAVLDEVYWIGRE